MRWESALLSLTTTATFSGDCARASGTAAKHMIRQARASSDRRIARRAGVIPNIVPQAALRSPAGRGDTESSVRPDVGRVDLHADRLANEIHTQHEARLRPFAHQPSRDTLEWPGTADAQRDA